MRLKHQSMSFQLWSSQMWCVHMYICTCMHVQRMMHPTELGSRQAQFRKARRKRELCVRDTTLFFVLVFVFIFSQESGKAGIVTAILEMRNPNHRDVKCPIKITQLAHREAGIPPSLSTQCPLFQIKNMLLIWDSTSSAPYSGHHRVNYKWWLGLPNPGTGTCKGLTTTTTLLIGPMKIKSFSVLLTAYMYNLKW